MDDLARQLHVSQCLKRKDAKEQEPRPVNLLESSITRSPVCGGHVFLARATTATVSRWSLIIVICKLAL